MTRGFWFIPICPLEHDRLGFVMWTCSHSWQRFDDYAVNQFWRCPSPIPPRAFTAGHLLTLSVPGVGHSQFYRGNRGLGISIPRGEPRAFDIRVFENLSCLWTPCTAICLNFAKIWISIVLIKIAPLRKNFNVPFLKYKHLHHWN